MTTEKYILINLAGFFYELETIVAFVSPILAVPMRKSYVPLTCRSPEAGNLRGGDSVIFIHG